jgi:hypothetical protein
MIRARDLNLDKLRKSYIKNCINNTGIDKPSKEDMEFLAVDTKTNVEFIKKALEEI